jgi:hypothetical protein
MQATLQEAQIGRIRQAIEPYRNQILNHPLYARIQGVEELRLFMQHHVFAVWDFMSLLKTLQNNLTCTHIPWIPVGDADTRYLINEIVVGEESDVDESGARKSHFELYLDAMRQAGADTHPMEGMVDKIRQRQPLQTVLSETKMPTAARDFVNFTFEIIQSGAVHRQAAIFTFGREDLIPGMFVSLVNDLHGQLPHQVSKFKYYLDRHIEVDGDHHGHLALEMTSRLCGQDEAKWDEAREATIGALKHRIALWDAALQAIHGGE